MYPDQQKPAKSKYAKILLVLNVLTLVIVLSTGIIASSGPGYDVIYYAVVAPFISILIIVILILDFIYIAKRLNEAALKKRKLSAIKLLMLILGFIVVSLLLYTNFRASVEYFIERNEYQGGREIDTQEALAEIQNCNVTYITQSEIGTSLGLKTQINAYDGSDYAVLNTADIDPLVEAANQEKARCGEVDITVSTSHTEDVGTAVKEIRSCNIENVSIPNRFDEPPLILLIPKLTTSPEGVIYDKSIDVDFKYQSEIIAASEYAEKACEGFYFSNHNDF